MAVASREGETASALNPNAPLFVPAAYQQVEDFSPEWWNLVHSSPWFCDYWLRERHQDDSNNFIPDEFKDTDSLPYHDFLEDFDEFTELELQMEEVVLSAMDGDNQSQQQSSSFTEFVQGNDAQVVDHQSVKKFTTGLDNETCELPSSN